MKNTSNQERTNLAALDHRLRDIVDIQIGYQERGNGQTKGMGGTHALIQLQDIGDTPPYISQGLSKITPMGNVDRYLIQKGDILFLSRGRRFRALLVEEDLQDTIAAYYFYILRMTREDVVPAYLAWFLNQSTSQAFFESHQRGSVVKMIPKGFFETIIIHLPPLNVQRAIANLQRLQIQENQTMRQLTMLREKLINQVGLQMTHGAKANKKMEISQ